MQSQRYDDNNNGKIKWNEKETKRNKNIYVYWNNLTDKKKGGITTVLFPFLNI